MRKRIALILAGCMVAASLAGCGNGSTSTSTAASVASSAQAQSASTAATSEASSQEASAIFAGGTGTESAPYQIETAEQLVAFAASVNDGSCAGYAGQYIELTSDLDLAGVEWTPIGNMNDKETYSTMFLGVFDGGNHTISNLSYESDTFNCGAGLFGINCGVVQNLTMEDAAVSVTDGTSLAIAAAVGYNMGSVDNVTVKNSTITGNNCTGGVIGGNKSTVANCKAENVTVTVIGDNDFSGGLVQADVAECGGLLIGGGFGGTIDNCSATGTVRAEGNEPVGLGGIGGCLEMMDSITNCTADVTIESAKGGHAIGGLCGYAGTHSNPDVCLETEGFSTTNYPSVIDNCNVTVTIKADGATHVGGLVGTGLYYYGEETAFAITNCSVSGTIDGAVTPGTIAGRAEGSTIENCTADVLVDGAAAADEVGQTTCMYESADQ